MSDMVERDASGNILSVRTMNDDTNELVIEYDFVSNTVINHSEVPEEDRVTELTDEVKAHFNEASNKLTVEDKLAANVVAMQQVVNGLNAVLALPNSEITVDARWMKQNVLRPLVDIAQNVKRLDRMVLKDFRTPE